MKVHRLITVFMSHLCAALFAAAAATAPPAKTTRADVALAGLQQYFFDSSSGFWKACGQNGGLGNAKSNFECECDRRTPFCRNCFRWWMAGTVQALVSLNAAVPNHATSNSTRQIIEQFWRRAPYTQRASPTWAYIDDYLWYVLMWLDVHRWLDEPRFLTEATDTFDFLWSWGADQVCGGIIWMYPDADPRKNAVTTLEAIQAAAQLSVALRDRAPLRAHRFKDRALALWQFFDDVGLLGADGLVHDNVTGTAQGEFHCCNRTHAPKCAPRNTVTWTYNQGMLLGAAVDLHALTGDTKFLAVGAKTLDAVVAELTTDNGGGSSGGRSSSIAQAKTVLREPVGRFVLTSRQCDASHDPSAPAGGDLFSFKAVFMQQLPRFVEACIRSPGALTPSRLTAARKLVEDSAEAAWATRVHAPFPASDICNEYRNVPTSAPPKFSWDWEGPPQGEALTCMDARTQSQALSVFVADIRMQRFVVQAR